MGEMEEEVGTVAVAEVEVSFGVISCYGNLRGLSGFFNGKLLLLGGRGRGRGGGRNYGDRDDGDDNNGGKACGFIRI